MKYALQLDLSRQDSREGSVCYAQREVLHAESANAIYAILFMSVGQRESVPLMLRRMLTYPPVLIPNATALAAKVSPCSPNSPNRCLLRARLDTLATAGVMHTS